MMFGWKRRRDSLLEEFEEHIEIETQENIERGMSPAEARRSAKRKFGSTLLAAEESREVWGGVWLERLAQDVRYAVRSLRRSRAHTTALVCTLALGLGCVTTMTAIVESILLRPVALPHAEQLVQIYGQDGASGMSTTSHALSYGAIDELRRNTRSFAAVSGYNTMVHPVRTADGTRVTPVVEVATEFFSTLGVEARLGRLIGGRDANDPSAVVSDEFWRERMRADPHAVGSTIHISGRPRTVIGVLPAGVHVPLGTGGTIVYLPVAVKASGEDEFGIESAATIARLKPGVSRQQALADAESVFLHTKRKHAEQSRHLSIRSYQKVVVGEMERPLLALLGGVVVLLLISCANAANLQIGRAANRMPEMSVRSALGAGFGRLLQQLVTESVLVSMVGAALGGGLSYAAVRMVRHAYGGQFARFDELAVRPMVLVFTAALAVLVGVVATIAPMLTIHRQITAQFSAKNVTRRSHLPGVLVTLQVALTCVLLVISGLFVRTLQSLESVRLGFDPRGVTTLVLMPEDQKQPPQRSREIEIELLHRFEALAGVQSATMQTEIPFSNYNMVLNGTTEIPGRPFKSGDDAFYSLVSTNFVQTSGIHLLHGRGFLKSDESEAGVVVLVNEAFLKKYLTGREPIGSRIRFHREPGETDADLPFTQAMTIVGVVENEMQGGDLGAPYKPMVYLNNLQLPQDSFLEQVFSMAAQYAVRSTLAPNVLASELRRVVNREAPGMVEMSLRPMSEGIERSLGQRWLAMRLVGGFGVAALVLSAVGIYGVLTYSVARRRREIGIRIALGSTRSKAAGLVVRQAAAMVLLGLLPGFGVAWCAGYALRSFLYGVRPLDPITLLSAGAVLLLIAVAATCLPAMRAAQVDPMEAVRSE